MMIIEKNLNNESITLRHTTGRRIYFKIGNSDKAIEYVSKKNKLTPVNAEIYSIYVIGLHYPDII